MKEREQILERLRKRLSEVRSHLKSPHPHDVYKKDGRILELTYCISLIENTIPTRTSKEKP